MNMYSAEITRELFLKLVPNDTPVDKVYETEHARRLEFVVDGTRLYRIDNYLSGVAQYFVQDINA